MLKYILKIMLDQKGLTPMTALSFGLGASNLFGNLFGGDDEEIIDPFEQWRSPFMEKISQFEPSEFKFNESFRINQPETEKMAESLLQEGLLNLPQKRQDIQDINDQYYDARKKRMQARHEEDIASTKEMYNRLGIVSSKPGLKGVQDLREKQSLEFGELEAELMNEAINQEMQEMALIDTITQNYFNQARQFGAAETGRNVTGLQLSLQDMERMFGEQLSYDQIMASLLGGSPPVVSYQPNTASEIGTTMQDLLTTYFLSQL